MGKEEQKKHQYRPHGGQQDHLHLANRDQDQKSAAGSWKDKWDDTKVILQSRYNELTNEDLNYSKGREEEDVYARVGKRLGKTRQEIEEMFDDIYKGRLKR